MWRFGTQFPLERCTTSLRVVTRTLPVALLAASLLAAGPERAWQTGTWRGYQVVRPKVVFGVGRPPRVGSPSPSIVEVRTYVIETNDLRLELKETTTADARRLDVSIGDPVTFALEKNTVYVKMDDGAERKLSVTKRIGRTKA